MSDNTKINSGFGGDVIRFAEKSGIKTQVVQLDVGGSSSEVLLTGVARGTQGSTAVPVQPHEDSGRSISLYTSAGNGTSSPVTTAGTSTNTLMFMMNNRGGTLTSGAASPAVITVGKIYRITAITITFLSLVTTATTAKVAIRYNPIGTVSSATTGVEVCAWIIGSAGTTATAGFGAAADLLIPDGLEFKGGGGIGVTLQGLNSAGTTGASSGSVQVSIMGFEY